jgi:hypothetical protein
MTPCAARDKVFGTVVSRGRLFFAADLPLSATSLSFTSPGRAQDGVDRASAFDKRLFAGLSANTFARFVRRRDANNMAQSSETESQRDEAARQGGDSTGEEADELFIPLRRQYRARPGDFGSSGCCNHMIAEGCGVDCEGGPRACRLRQHHEIAECELEGLAGRLRQRRPRRRGPPRSSCSLRDISTCAPDPGLLFAYLPLCRHNSPPAS